MNEFFFLKENNVSFSKYWDFCKLVKPQTLKSVRLQRYNLTLEVIFSIVSIIVTQAVFTYPKSTLEKLQRF